MKIPCEVRDRSGFSLVGSVVMPEHIHLPIDDPAKSAPPAVMQVLKQRVSRRRSAACRERLPPSQ